MTWAEAKNRMIQGIVHKYVIVCFCMLTPHEKGGDYIYICVLYTYICYIMLYIHTLYSVYVCILCILFRRHSIN